MDSERIMRLLSLMVEDWKSKYNKSRVSKSYSPELREAIKLLEELRTNRNDYLTIDLKMIPGYSRGQLTRDDVMAIIMDALRIL